VRALEGGFCRAVQCAAAIGVIGVGALVAEPRRPAPGVVSAALSDWPEGPVRWLLLPSEVKVFRELRSDESVRAFIREFWRRRDPDPSPRAPGNPVADEFATRVDLADRLYAGEEVRGSLSDRGGAFLLLGPPVYVRVGRRREPMLDLRRSGATSAPGAAPTRLVEFEEWGYPPSALPSRLLEMESGLGEEERIRLVFVKRDGRVTLREGRALLAAAARAIVIDR
jgi:GWxTD domain-containing protein